MKNYDIDDINELIKQKGIKYLDTDKEKLNDAYTAEEFDSAKTRILKYVLYKKRTEKEIRVKFSTVYGQELLDNVIDSLIELNYINDNSYIDRTINEYIALKNLSIKELKYKLLSKGIKSNLIDDYISDHYEELDEYEKKSACSIANKKKSSMDEISIKAYLMKKGYKEESIKEAL